MPWLLLSTVRYLVLSNKHSEVYGWCDRNLVGVRSDVVAPGHGCNRRNRRNLSNFGGVQKQRAPLAMLVREEHTS
jgi:hypothetical protein